jgi:hypothetical protein
MTNQYKQDPPQKPILGYASIYASSSKDTIAIIDKLNVVEKELAEVKEVLGIIKRELALIKRGQGLAFTHP